MTEVRDGTRISQFLTEHLPGQKDRGEGKIDAYSRLTKGAVDWLFTCKSRREDLY